MRILPFALAAASLTSATPAFACASCGCTLSADWLNQGLVAQPGSTAAIRHDYVPQTQLRTDRREVTDAEKALPADREIERYTYNSYLTASLDQQFENDFGVNVQVPVIRRPHSTFGEDETESSYSRTEGIGDIRITARWQGFETPGCINGIQVGLVLPTGRTRQTFRSGPEAGEQVDRGLQTGTGTVQAIAGYYLYGKLSADFDYIVQLQGQIPFGSHDGYRPGTVGQASAGLHYSRWKAITPQVELTFRASARDAGYDSDRANSGGEQVYLSPGVIVPVGARASVFGYVQLPLYQRLNGFQLSPRASVSTGLQYRF